MFSKVRLFDSISILNSKCGTVPDKMFDLLRSLLLFLVCRLLSLSDGGFSKHVYAKSFHCYRLNLDGPFFTSTIPFVEFNIQFQTNSLIYDKGYSTRQYMIYSLILFMKEEGLGYRRISKKLNQWGIKTHRGCEWFNTSVSSVLKRKHERDDLVNNIRNKHYPSKISKMKLKYYTFD